ncbi:hypothetical protein Tco_0856344 [Tanacetum coccineum]|uniref:Uncharacterized protein n=1 Tax=Tanacetum coccineum TaxID=301880 RepID=A0ABQ5B572_9ASTR
MQHLWRDRLGQLDAMADVSSKQIEFPNYGWWAIRRISREKELNWLLISYEVTMEINIFRKPLTTILHSQAKSSKFFDDIHSQDLDYTSCLDSLLHLLYYVSKVKSHYLTVGIGGENRRVAQHVVGMLRMDACYLELKIPSRSRRDGADNPDATKKKLAARGCFFQEGKDTEDPSWSTSFKTRSTQKTSSALEALWKTLFVLYLYLIGTFHYLTVGIGGENRRVAQHVVGSINYSYCIHADQDGDHTMTSSNTSNIKELDADKKFMAHLPLLQKQTSQHDIRMLRMDACYLELKIPSRSRRDGSYDFLTIMEMPLLALYFHHSVDNPDATKKKLAVRGCFFQEGTLGTMAMVKDHRLGKEYLEKCVDIIKISRKRLKSGKHEHGNRRARKEPGKCYIKGQ